MADAGLFPRPFGKYTLLASLGRGGMGEVFAAVVGGGIAGIEKRCVIKTLHLNYSDDREYVQRFTDEARLVVQLNQKNICSVFDVGVIDNQHYLAMDMVRGKDLRTVWRQAGELARPLNAGVVVHIVAEVLDALDYAHTLTDGAGHPLHIVHRDVSPQNVMVSLDGDVKVIDFGLAASTEKVEKTETNVVMGKVAYMPPEQVQGERADARADLFAVGVMLYELLAQERYYEGIGHLLLPAVVATGQHVPAGMAEIDAELQGIIRRAVAADRNARTPSAAVFAEELRAFASRRGLRGDAAILRREMKELFGPASREGWEASSGGALAALKSPLPTPAAVADTTAIAPAAPAEDPLAPTTLTELVRPPPPAPPVDLTVSSKSQPLTAATTAVKPAKGAGTPKKRRRLLIAAGLGALAFVALCSGAVQKEKRAKARHTLASVVVDAGPAVPVVAVSSVDAGAQPAAVIVDAGAAAVAADAAADAGRGPGPRPPPKDKGERPVDKKPAPRPLDNAFDNFNFAAAQCPALPCTKTLAANGKMPKDDPRWLNAADFKKLAATCYVSCARKVGP